MMMKINNLRKKTMKMKMLGMMMKVILKKRILKKIKKMAQTHLTTIKTCQTIPIQND